MRRGTKATWQSHRWPTRGARMTRVHVSLYFILYNGYSTYKRSIEELKLTLCFLLPYIPDMSSEFSQCGTMFCGISLCRRRGRVTSVGSHREDVDRVDPRPRDQDRGTCVKVTLSGRDRSAYLTPRGDTRSARSSSKADVARSPSNYPLS